MTASIDVKSPAGEPLEESDRRPQRDFNGDGYILFGLGVALTISAVALPLSQGQQLVVLSAAMALGILGLLRANWIALAVIATPVWTYLGVFASNIEIEKGAYIGEQFRHGQYIGSTLLFVVYALGFMGVTHVFIMRSIKPWPEGTEELRAEIMPKYLRYFSLVLLVLIIIQFGVVAVYGTSQTADRFEYWNAMPDGLRSMVQAIRAMNTPIFMAAGFLLVSAGKNRLNRFVLLELVVLQVPLLLMGDKFSPFVNAVLGGLGGLAFANALMGRKVRFKVRYAFWGMALAAALVTSLFVGLSRMTTGVDVVTAFWRRAVLQGHVWYGIVEKVQLQGAPLLPVRDLLMRDSLEHHTGLNALSLFVSDPVWVTNRLARGIPFTMGGPPAPLALYGPLLGFIVFVAMGAFLYTFQFKFITAAARQGKFITMAVGFLFVLSVNAVMIMGNWFSLYNTMSMMLWFFILLWAFFPTGKFSKVLAEQKKTAEQKKPF